MVHLPCQVQLLEHPWKIPVQEILCVFPHPFMPRGYHMEFMILVENDLGE